MVANRPPSALPGLFNMQCWPMAIHNPRQRDLFGTHGKDLVLHVLISSPENNKHMSSDKFKGDQLFKHILKQPTVLST